MNPAWPEIEGIDSGEASARWCGDLTVYATIMEQLFERFGDVCRGDGEIRLDNIKDGARRMHKLRGAAASLGARRIYFIAGQLESAYLAQDLSMAAHLKGRLADEMCRLLENSQAALAEVRARAREAEERANVEAARAVADGAESPADLRRLDELLQRQDLGALSLFRSVSPALQQRLGADPYRRLLGHVENLRFDEAADDLRTALGGRRP